MDTYRMSTVLEMMKYNVLIFIHRTKAGYSVNQIEKFYQILPVLTHHYSSQDINDFGILNKMLNSLNVTIKQLMLQVFL